MHRLARIPAYGIFALLGLAQPASAADLTIRFAWTIPPHTATGDQAEAIAKNIEAMSHGKIAVQTYPAGSLVNQSTMGQALSNNTVNMGILGVHWWSSREPALDWDSIPFLVSEPRKLMPAFHGQLGDDMNAVLAKHGVTLIGWGFYGYSISYTNVKHPIRVPADLEGLKMRSDGRLNGVFMKEQGAIPVAVDSSEVYTALQRGTLDGAASGLASFVSRKWMEVCKYVTPIHYSPSVYPVQANAAWWKGLTQEQRDIISKAIEATEEPNLKEIEDAFQNDMAVLEKAGLELYRPNADELNLWHAAEASATETYLKSAGPTGQKMLDQVKAAMAAN